jgi:two-component system response regulator
VTQCLLLLVEDDDNDRALIVRSLSKVGLECTFQIAHDGAEAAFLLGLSASRPPSILLPDLVLLDAKMPRMGGLEILELIRQNPTTQGLKVVVLSSSADPGDAARARELGATYVQKSAHYDAFVQVVQRVVLEALGRAGGGSGSGG